MSKTVKIPSMVFTDIDTTAFRAECLKKTAPDHAPEFGIGDVVMYESSFGRELPAVVISILSKSPGGAWHYELARPRIADGVIERVGATAQRMKLLDKA